MLSQGAGDKPSDWLRVFANTFRWLAEPSLQAGRGGATTPPEVLNPPVQVWPQAPLLDWSKQPPLQDQLQTAGLIGARTALSSGAGTVADYVQAARAAGLQFLVFLEDSLKMDQARWDQLVEQCKAASDDTFLAVPGLTYEDAAPSAMIGASNHFEVAIATATMLFGLSSGAALSTVVGVLIEVPVMLMLVKICLRSQSWFRSGATR